MSRRLRITGLILTAIVLLIAVAVVLVYRASQYVPPFYHDAMAADAELQRRSSDEMLGLSTALVSDVRNRGRWEAMFTAEQINGWLAVDLVENYPDALAPEIAAPRVDITPTAIVLACRLRWKGVSSVVSLTVEPYMAGANVLGLRFRRARAGRLPMPLGQVLNGLTTAARNANLDIQWRYTDGDPVALLSLRKKVQLETLRLEAGRIYLAGRTE